MNTIPEFRGSTYYLAVVQLHALSVDYKTQPGHTKHTANKLEHERQKKKVMKAKNNTI